MKYFSLLLVAMSLLFAAFTWQLPTDEDWRSKVDSDLLDLAEIQAEVEFLILLSSQADVSDAKFLSGKASKGAFVYETLQAVAAQTQAPVVELLEAAGATYQSFYIVNAVHAKGDLALLEQVASLNIVSEIQSNPSSYMDRPAMNATDSGAPRNALEWGVERINANDVWDMGYSGQGVVVAGEDTGYDWEHPTIKSKYRGWNGSTADHNYNWHDAIHEINPLHGDTVVSADLNPCGLDSQIPCDDHNHGTHTMGTMVGDDGGENQIGVAPGASWIACRNMERGYGSPATYIECFEWFLAPTDLNGGNADPTKAPHVINNSWSCPEMEGCNPGNWATMEMVVNNLKSAGIVVVVSAGNSGSNCGTVQAPAAMFENSFTIGASNSNEGITGFSSRGPVFVDGSNRMKPNVVAPGAQVRSAIRNGGYATWNGTSMAAPHVAGVVALMISAVPELAGEVETIESIIEQTAMPLETDQECGGIAATQIPNPIYGYGRIDALAAVQEAMLTISSVINQTEEGVIQIYPNPFKDKLTFHFHDINGAVQVELFTPAGQYLQRHEWLVYNDTPRELDLGNLPGGMYYYRISDGDLSISGKVLKQ